MQAPKSKLYLDSREIQSIQGSRETLWLKLVIRSSRGSTCEGSKRGLLLKKLFSKKINKEEKRKLFSEEPVPTPCYLLSKSHQSWKEEMVTGRGQQLRGKTVMCPYQQVHACLTHVCVPPLTINVTKYLTVKM